MSDPILDALNRAPLEYTDEDLDRVIAYVRKSKLMHDSGVKPKKEGSDIDLVALLNVKPKISSEGRR